MLLLLNVQRNDPELIPLQQPLCAPVPTNIPAACKRTNQRGGKYRIGCCNKKHAHIGRHAVGEPCTTRISSPVSSVACATFSSAYLSRITHTFSALCIHTIHFGRVTGTARKLAEHRAKLCLLGLKELQKSWDLENWVLDLFFRCLDDRTARNLRLVDNGRGASGLSNPLAKRDPGAAQTPSLDPTGTGMSITRPPSPSDAILPMAPTGPSLNQSEDPSVNMDWYELFNVEGEDFSGLAGSLTNPDSLNPQNLEFLYRFL